MTSSTVFALHKSVSLESVKGWHNRASAARLVLPRRCIIRKPQERVLFQLEESGVGNLVQGSITKYLSQGFMVSDDDKVMTSNRKELGLLQAIARASP